MDRRTRDRQRGAWANRLAVGALLLLSLTAWADQDRFSAEAVSTALAALNARPLDDHWFFTMQIEHEGQSQVVRSDPRKLPAERRSLITVDGQPPTEKELTAFRSTEAERIEEQDENQGFGQLIDTESLNLLDVTDGVAEYAFIPVIPKLEKAGESLRGKLLLDTQRNAIRSIDIFNIESFSPALSVSLEHFRLLFLFEEQQGENLLAVTESQTRGKLAHVKEFESKTRIAFSEYEPLTQ